MASKCETRGVLKKDHEKQGARVLKEQEEKADGEYQFITSKYRGNSGYRSCNCHKEREVRKSKLKDIKGSLTFGDAFDDPSDFPLSCSDFFENIIWP